MTASPRSHKLDLAWPIIICVIIIVAVTTVYLNSKHTDDSASKTTNALDIDNGDLTINWDRYPTRQVNLDSTYRITSSGTYHLTGTITDGNIIINTGADGEVRLILDNVSISNSTGPAIYCQQGDDLVIELIGENTLIDGDTYDASYDVDVTGAIYSKADLTFQGNGSLNLIANYADGIVSKDDLKFNSGTHNITATDDAIRGKDSVYIANGNFKIDAGADAIKSTNDVDFNKGFVLIEQGNLNLTSGAKGIKATQDIVIYGGNFVINSADDAVHCDNYVGIVDGTFSINSSDDAIHANNELVIDGGDITIAKTYEGLEAQVITINNGNINIIASDDGINAGNGADNSATNNRMGGGAFDADANCILSINGGNLHVNASGDGIDSNGWLYINGGHTIVDGPTNNGNGSLDAGMGIVMNGGEVLAIGSSGMAESLGSTSSINNISVYLDNIYPAGSKITIQDSTGDTIFEHTSAKSFSHLTAGSPIFTIGKSYTLYIDDAKVAELTIASTVTESGKNTNQQIPPGSRSNNMINR